MWLSVASLSLSLSLSPYFATLCIFLLKWNNKFVCHNIFLLNLMSFLIPAGIIVNEWMITYNAPPPKKKKPTTKQQQHKTHFHTGICMFTTQLCWYLMSKSAWSLIFLGRCGSSLGPSSGQQLYLLLHKPQRWRWLQQRRLQSGQQRLPLQPLPSPIWQSQQARGWKRLLSLLAIILLWLRRDCWRFWAQLHTRFRIKESGCVSD